MCWNFYEALHLVWRVPYFCCLLTVTPNWKESQSSVWKGTSHRRTVQLTEMEAYCDTPFYLIACIDTTNRHRHHHQHHHITITTSHHNRALDATGNGTGSNRFTINQLIRCFMCFWQSLMHIFDNWFFECKQMYPNATITTSDQLIPTIVIDRIFKMHFAIQRHIRNNW